MVMESRGLAAVVVVSVECQVLKCGMAHALGIGGKHMEEGGCVTKIGCCGWGRAGSSGGECKVTCMGAA